MPSSLTPKPLLFSRVGALCAAAVLSVPAYLVVAAHAQPSAVSLAADRSRADQRHETERANGSPVSVGVISRARRRPEPSTLVTARTKPAARHPAVRRPAARAARWLPTGTGMWTHVWLRTDGGDPRRVIAQAHKAGLSTIYVRTGSSHDGFVGAPALNGLLPRLPKTGLTVVAWDFPTLADPVRDAKRLAHAARWGRSSRSRVMAVAPDIETAAEGTHINAKRVRQYMQVLRANLPSDVAILATTPWPSRYRVGRYPYATVARYADAIMPMAYWYDSSSVEVTKTSMSYLRRFGKPVLPVGQGYDSRVDVPWLPASHPVPELRGFFNTAKNAGARAVSLWSWQTAGKVQWTYLAKARHAFPARH